MESIMRAADFYPDGPWGRTLLPLLNTQYHWPFVGVTPIIVGCLALPLGPGGMPVLAVAAWAALGWLLWTLGEYLMHRFAFHYEPRTDPRVIRLILVPVIISVPILLGWALLGYALIGYGGVALVGGHAAGYLYYEHVHYSCHHGRRKIGWTKKQRKLHMYHHFKDHDRWFGVSTHLWDYVFRTHVHCAADAPEAASDSPS